MKKVLFLLSMFIAVGSAMFAQWDPVTPETNVYLTQTFSDKLEDFVPYNNGVMYYSNGQFTDAVGTITEGEKVSVIETLQANTISKLSAWPNDSKAYYYGDADNSYGTELRVFDGSSASMLRNAGHGIYPACTNVERMEYSNGKVVYYYMTLGNYAEISGGYEAIVNETDGTHMGTSSISIQNGQIIRHNGVSQGGVFSGFADGDIFNFVSAVPGSLGNYSALLEVEDGNTGSSAKYLFNNGSESAVMDEVFAYEDYYLITETQDLFSLTTVDRSNFNNIASVANYKFFTKTFVRANDKVFGIGGPETSVDPRNFRKLIVVENKVATSLSLNNENVTDNVHNLTLSGNKLYFSATNANGENGLYAIDVTVTNPEVVLVDEFFSSEITAITAVDGGVAYAYFNPLTNSSTITITNGYSDADYSLYRGQDDGMFIFGYIDDLAYNGGYLYISENNENGGTNVWHHNLSDDNFASSNSEVTVSDALSGEIIEGATLSISNGFDTYTAISDASGVCTFSTVAPGVYSYSVSAPNYLTNAVNVSSYTNYPIWLNSGDNNNSVRMYGEGNQADFNFIIEDGNNWNQITGGAKLGNATVTLTSGPYNYSAVSDDETSFDHGFAHFTNVNYGLYEYEVVCDGYTTYTGFFNVNENTLEGETVSLTPSATLSFLAELSWSSPEYPYGGGVHVLLESVTDPNIVFYVATNGSTDEEPEPKVYIYDVPHGEYKISYTEFGHIQINDEITIDDDQDIIFSMDEAKGDFIFNITGNEAPLTNATIYLYEGDSEYNYTTQTTDANGSATFTDVYFGEYRYEVIFEGFTTGVGELVWDEHYENWPNSSLNVNLDPPGSIIAFITASDLSDSFNNLGGATVTLTNTEDASISFSGVTGSTMLDLGYVEFSEVPYGTYDYVVSADGYFTVAGQYVLDGNSTTGIEETLNPEVKSFNAFVIEQGSLIGGGINGASVTLTSTTDASIVFSGETSEVLFEDGICEFFDIPYDVYNYEIVADGYVSASGQHTVDDTEGGIEVYLQPAFGDILVSVLDNDLLELEGALIKLTDINDSEITFTGTTDSEGNYSFTNIPFASYAYEIAKDSYVTITDTYVLDENTTGGIDVRLAMALFDLTITVVNRSEEFVEGATVTIRSTTDGELDFTIESDETGTAVITELPYGTYTYEVLAENYQPMEGEYSIDVDSETELTITLDRRVGVDEVEANVRIYPNPVSDILYIVSDSPIEAIGIYALNGQKIKDVNTGNLNQVRVSDLSAGIYLVKVYDINGNIILRKVNKL